LQLIDAAKVPADIGALVQTALDELSTYQKT
jgi:hypothetical protein